MRCPRCSKNLGDGLLPARCPECGLKLSGGAGESMSERRAHADQALASRMSVEGLSGRGVGRVHKGSGTKRTSRIFLGFALVVLFCGLVYFVAYKAEVVGGRSVPNVVGWSQAQATEQLEDKGFAVGTNEVETSEETEGRVITMSPEAGTRAARGTTVTIDVAVSATATEGEQTTETTE
jgi:hypothetical protein